MRGRKSEEAVDTEAEEADSATAVLAVSACYRRSTYRRSTYRRFTNRLVHLTFRPSRGRNSVVECQLPKLDVAGSSPVARSDKLAGRFTSSPPSLFSLRLAVVRVAPPHGDTCACRCLAQASRIRLSHGNA